MPGMPLCISFSNKILCLTLSNVFVISMTHVLTSDPFQRKYSIDSTAIHVHIFVEFLRKYSIDSTAIHVHIFVEFQRK